MRVEELCYLPVKDVQERRGTPFFCVLGKRSKIRYVLVHVHPIARTRIHEYLEQVGHGEDKDGPLFKPVKNNVNKTLDKHLDTSSVYRVLRKYGLEVCISRECLSPHVLRTTMITNALDHEADIAKVQETAGHASISTTRLYDRRKNKPEDSPVNLVAY